MCACLCYVRIKNIMDCFSSSWPHSFKHPWNFLSESSIYYANGVTQSGALESFRMGLVTRKTNHRSRGSDFRPTGGEGVGG